MTCGTCYGRKFVRSGDGVWSPCGVCYWQAVSDSYVKPMIRQSDTMLPATFGAEEAWPLTSRVETGDYAAFRFRVWRSLLHYFPAKLTYDYFEAWRLTELQFEREHVEEYSSIRDLKGLGLLVMVLGIADPPNSYTMPLVKYVTELRTMHGLPTWLYTKSKGALNAPPPKDALPVRQQAPPVRKQIF